MGENDNVHGGMQPDEGFRHVAEPDNDAEGHALTSNESNQGTAPDEGRRWPQPDGDGAPEPDDGFKLHR